jgi:hypothetical protein
VSLLPRSQFTIAAICIIGNQFANDGPIFCCSVDPEKKSFAYNDDIGPDIFAKQNGTESKQYQRSFFLKKRPRQSNHKEASKFCNKTAISSINKNRHLYQKHNPATLSITISSINKNSNFIELFHI